ncbi:MAG: phosphoribosyltransferase [Deltaproteobacteria bacterium]|nr:phosphoribosyltransferase [Deltaproteobacteria bacterium]
MYFQNREQAAHLLAMKLDKYRGRHPLILAIPRGAVPMGRILSEELQGELDVVLVKKIGAPQNPEFALGAVDEQGQVYLNSYAKQLLPNGDFLLKEKNQQLELLRKRRKLYTPQRNSIDPKDRIVIVVDDGIATGATMLAALQLIRQRHPKKLIVATAVAPEDTFSRLQDFADEVFCLSVPEDFQAVGRFFKNFEQVSDDEVLACFA